MASVIVHYVLGLMVSYLFFKRRGRPLFGMSVFALAPDFDVFFNAGMFLFLKVASIDHSTYVVLNDLFGHRGISHSLTLLAAVGIVVLIVTRKKRTAMEAGLLVGVHLLSDLFINWEEILLFPITRTQFQLGSMTFMDPFINILTLLLLFAFIFFTYLSWEKTIKKRGERWTDFRAAFPIIVKVSLVAICVYLLALTAWKGAALYSREDAGDVSYQETAAYGYYDFVYVVDHNETHWRVVEFNLFSTEDITVYHEKVRISENDAASLAELNLSSEDVVARCDRLLDYEEAHEPLKDYWIHEISVEKDNRTITARVWDARGEVHGDPPMPYEAYRFEFQNGGLDEFKAYYSGRDVETGRVPSYVFE